MTTIRETRETLKQYIVKLLNNEKKLFDENQILKGQISNLENGSQNGSHSELVAPIEVITLMDARETDLTQTIARIEEENEKLKSDLTLITEKFNSRDKSTTEFTNLVVGTMCLTRAYVLRSTYAFLGKHVPGKRFPFGSSMRFTDINDPILQAVIDIFQGGMPASFISTFKRRLEQLFDKGYFGRNHGAKTQHSILLGEFVAHFSSEPSTSKFIKLHFSPITSVTLVTRYDHNIDHLISHPYLYEFHPNCVYYNSQDLQTISSRLLATV